jgi:hypothetical protein
MCSRVAILAVLALLAATVPTASASAEEFGIAPGGFAVQMLNAEGNPESRAGSHPDRLQIDFGFEGQSPDAMELEMPPGFGGDPGAVPECARKAGEEGEECPPDTQVGVLALGPPGGSGLTLPIYRLESGPGEIATFGSKPGIELHSAFELRPSDLGITFRLTDLAESGLKEGRIEFWGVPADHQEGTLAERRPFLTTPLTCGPLAFTLRARSGQAGAPWLSATAQTSVPQSGCESLAFDPRLGLRLSNPVADSPTGLSIELIQPEAGSESELANTQPKDVTIQLPAGMTVSPAGVGGLVACSDAELGLGDAGDASCPPGSRVGGVEVSAPALGSLAGAVYLGEERPGERFRLFVVVPGPGFVLKFVGALKVDPVTGRLSATLSNLPQVAIARIVMSLDGGPRSLLATPLACGPAAATASFAPYGGGPAVGSTAAVGIAGRVPALQCPGMSPFAPRLALGQSTNLAGRPNVVSMALSRADGEPLPRRFHIALPAGVTAALGSVTVCPAALAAAAACPAASRVGGALAEAGPGDAPARLPGDVYLTGPHRRAPLGLLFEIGARLGQFDLGTIAFRAAVHVHRRSGRVIVVSDPIPEAIEGLQVRLRSIELSLDRPGLVRNPTSCRPSEANGGIESASGASVDTSSPFRVRGCGRLRFKPRLRLALKARSVRPRAHVALLVRVRMRRSETALRAMRIALPRAVRFDPAGLGAICSRPDARHGECPRGSRIGTVAGRSPLFRGRLKGGAYLVDPGNQRQPDIWISLAQAGIRVEMKGTMRIRRGRFIARLSGLPDMPLAALTLRLGRVGGGILSLSRAPCPGGLGDRLVSALFIRGQNAARRKLRLPIATRACRQTRCRSCLCCASPHGAGAGKR